MYIFTWLIKYVIIISVNEIDCIGDFCMFQYLKSEPIINSFWFWSDPLIIIKNVKNSMFWIYNNFINLRVYNEEPLSNLYFYNGCYRNKMVEMFDCPYLSMQKINFDIHNEKQLLGTYSLEEIIKYSKDYNLFILLMVNRFHIKVYNYKEENNHQILIYHYDEKNNIVKFCDNFSDGKFRTNLSCTINEIKKAYINFNGQKNEPDFSTGIFLLQPREDNTYTILWERIKEQIVLFLNKQNVLNTEWWSYGIKVYDIIIIGLKNAIKSLNSIDYKFICVLYDHKKVMLLRLQMLRLYFEFNDELIDDYMVIKNKTNILVNLILKYNKTRKISILYKCINILSEIMNDEEHILNSIVEAMPDPIPKSIKK